MKLHLDNNQDGFELVICSYHSCHNPRFFSLASLCKPAKYSAYSTFGARVLYDIQFYTG